MQMNVFVNYYVWVEASLGPIEVKKVIMADEECCEELLVLV